MEVEAEGSDANNAATAREADSAAGRPGGRQAGPAAEGSTDLGEGAEEESAEGSGIDVLTNTPGYVTVRVRYGAASIEVHARDGAGQPYRRLSRLRSELVRQGRDPFMLVNAGMYHDDLGPVGLLVVAGEETAPLNLSTGEGNFFLLPNGVFAVSDDVPSIWESAAFAAGRPNVTHATQSGPLLLHRGVIHPRLLPDATSRKIRNSVCVNGQDAWFTISTEPVTFYALAVHLRDVLGCTDALYLDGTISSMLIPGRDVAFEGADLGPMIAVFAH